MWKSVEKRHVGYQTCAQRSSVELTTSTQHSQGAVEQQWDLGDKTIRFVAYAVPGNSGLLLGRSDLKALGATIRETTNCTWRTRSPLWNFPRLQRVTARVDLLNLTSGAATVDPTTGIPGSTVKVLAKVETHPKFFERGGSSPEAGLLVSEILPDQRLQGKIDRRGCAARNVCLRPSDDFVSQLALSVLWEHVEGCRPLCVVMTPTHNRLLDFAVEIVTAQVRNGRHFLCITPTNSSLSHARSLQDLRSIRGVHTAIVDSCTFGCRCVGDGTFGGSKMAARDDSATTREENAAKVYRRSFSRATNSGSADACPFATSHCKEPTPN